MSAAGGGAGHQLGELLADPNAPGETLRVLAGETDVAPDILARLAADERRLKETPAIATAIFANPGAPMSVANLAVLTCHRVGVVPEGIPGFEEMAAAIVADPAALDSAAVDSGFDQLLHGAPDTDDPLPETPLPGDPTGTDAQTASTPESPFPVAPSLPAAATATATSQSPKRRSAIIDFTRLKLYEKIRLATLGNAYCRRNLLRDSNRMVAMAVIRSPQITDGEIVKAAGNRALSEEVIRYIGNRKELVKQYPVKLALVGNAKCPLTIALRLLPTLAADDIKQLARSKNVPGALATAAKRLAATKAPQ